METSSKNTTPKAEIMHCSRCQSRSSVSNVSVKPVTFNSWKRGTPMERHHKRGTCNHCGMNIVKFVKKP